MEGSVSNVHGVRKKITGSRFSTLDFTNALKIPSLGGLMHGGTEDLKTRNYAKKMLKLLCIRLL